MTIRTHPYTKWQTDRDIQEHTEENTQGRGGQVNMSKVQNIGVIEAGTEERQDAESPTETHKEGLFKVKQFAQCRYKTMA